MKHRLGLLSIIFHLGIPNGYAQQINKVSAESAFAIFYVQHESDFDYRTDVDNAPLSDDQLFLHTSPLIWNFTDEYLSYIRALAADLTGRDPNDAIQKLVESAARMMWQREGDHAPVFSITSGKSERNYMFSALMTKYLIRAIDQLVVESVDSEADNWIISTHRLETMLHDLNEIGRARNNSHSLIAELADEPFLTYRVAYDETGKIHFVMCETLLKKQARYPSLLGAANRFNELRAKVALRLDLMRSADYRLQLYSLVIGDILLYAKAWLPIGPLICRNGTALTNEFLSYYKAS